ncbi:MAG TPA: glycoside hydrolase family 9 protein [Actinocrinis sp.]|uniref:glycoside hydrolase family 9 protein n=1 Tax=Actinocrinis sp. TaxID=1920516 RepID=UPI002DDDA977|nr:glycoside hydrolase family 9 protein [Actinocrinis sp.]HEV2346711.1 glycoside hydrolase family 9 protein [Actinocrinis sp.]
MSLTVPRIAGLLAAGLSLAALTAGGPARAATAAPAALANTPHYSLPLAAQESLYFYDAQKSGPARTDGDQPLDWRGDSEPSDACVPLQPKSSTVPNGVNLSAAFITANKSVLDPGNTGCLNLSGGFHDAGDHVKFGLPQSYAAATLGWGMYEFPQAYKTLGTWNHGLDEMKWFTDYFLRSTFLNSSGQVVAFAYQVGEGSVDHNYWGPSELQSSTTYPRPAYLASSETPAADQAASAAAALTVESLLTASSNATYSAKCLQYAEALYTFARAYPGLGYSGGFYNSGGYVDKEAWAADWLYLATGNFSYINDIISTNSSGTYTGYLSNIVTNTTNTWQNIWVMSWDARWGGVFSLLDPIVQGNANVSAILQQQVHYFDKWQVQYWSHVPHDNTSDTSFIATTPAGLSYLTTWGAARYDTAAQLEALVYRKSFPADAQSTAFTDWAMGQMNYLMGDNPSKWSYIVGFGSTTPGVGSLVGGSATAASHPHHADAHGSLTNNQGDPANDRHILWGALVGGPSSTDAPDDVTTDYVLNEVAVDYNAAMVGALAGLYQYYGQSQTVTSFTPPAEAAQSPYYTTATLNQDSNQGTQLTVNITNTATQPPHFETDMSARVYFDIASLHAQGQGISAISTPVYYDAAGQIDGKTTSISAPAQWGDANSCVYYVTVNWAGDNVGLPPSRAFEFGINAAQGPNFKYYWNSAASPSLTGLAAGTYASAADPYIPVYLNGTLASGQEPSKTLDESCGSSGGGTGGGTGGTPTLVAQYETSTTAATTSSISNQIQLVNTGSTAAQLSNVTVRYWFTEDGTQPLTYACDYAPVGCANVTGTFAAVSPAKATADHYLQLSFGSAAGTLAAGASTGGIQNRIYQSNYATMTQTNDYSFNAADSAFTANPTITVYYNGQLIYGTEP